MKSLKSQLVLFVGTMLLGCADRVAAPAIPLVNLERFLTWQLLINGTQSDGLQSSVLEKESVVLAFSFSSGDEANDRRAGVVKIAKPSRNGWVNVGSQGTIPIISEDGSTHSITARFPPLPAGIYRLQCTLVGDDEPIISQRLVVNQ